MRNKKERKKNYHQPMLDAMKCRMEQKIEGNCYGRKRTLEENARKNSNENYFFHVSRFQV